MSRPDGRRCSLSLAAAVLVALAAPSAAHAATYTVRAGDGGCGGADLACGGLVQAAAIAAPGDVFNLATGTYQAPTFTTGGVTINGDLGAVIDGTIEFAGNSGGVSKMSKVAATQGTAAAPAIYVSGTSGLELSDAVAISRDGFGIFITGGTANKIVRTAVATGGQATGAIQVEAGPDSDDLGLTVESTIVYGGGAGVRALTRNNEAEALAERTAGNVTLRLRHLTAAGSTHGIDLDASNARSLIGGGVGNITATLSDSLAFNNRTVSYPGTAGLGGLGILGANSAVLTAERSLQSGDPRTLFVNPGRGNFRLLPTAAAAINQGGVTPGESPTDIDGEDRATAPTDLGADEFNNAAPIAKIALATARPRSAQPVTFDARGSSDRDGSAIAQYRWRFSDGRSENTTQPFVRHTFAEEGDAAAALVVVDSTGLASPEVVTTFKLVDGTPPAVAIVKPKSKETIPLFTTKTRNVRRNGKTTKVRKRTRTRIQIGGLSADKAGMSRVLLTIQKVTARTKGGKRCHFYDARKGFLLVRCTKPRLITARLVKGDAGQWTYNVPMKRPLSAGSYRVAAYGVDKTGAFGNSAPARAATISFRIKK